MKRLLAAIVIAFSIGGVASAFTTGPVSGGGIPNGFNVSASAGGSSLFNANPNRVQLFCENVGTTNNIFLTFGQTATTTNGFLLAPNGGYWTPPACSAASPTARGNGCVPT